MTNLEQNQQEFKQKKIDETISWLFNLLNSQRNKRLILTSQQQRIFTLSFSAGCMLLAQGHEVGYFICARSLKVLNEWVPNIKTKSSDVLRFLKGNEERFARATSCSAEIVKAFSKLASKHD